MENVGHIGQTSMLQACLQTCIGWHNRTQGASHPQFNHRIDTAILIIMPSWMVIWSHRNAFSVYIYHYNDVIMSTMTSQITSLLIVYSTVHSSANQRKHQSSASLAFVRGIHRWPVNSPYKWPVTRKMFPLDDVIMIALCAVGVREVTGHRLLWFPDK